MKNLIPSSTLGLSTSKSVLDTCPTPASITTSERETEKVDGTPLGDVAIAKSQKSKTMS